MARQLCTASQPPEPREHHHSPGLIEIDNVHKRNRSYRRRNYPGVCSFDLRTLADIANLRATAGAASDPSPTFASTHHCLDLRIPELFLAVPQRTQSDCFDPIEVSIYITSTVLFAYVCPMMILLNAVPLFERVHPTMSAAPIIFVFLLHLSLYFLVFWTTNRFTSKAATEVRSDEPSDAHEERDKIFTNGNHIGPTTGRR